MGEIVNLRIARKRKARADAASQADQNRITFGRTKQERELTKAERALESKKLDAHRRETDAE
jgi:hypothetical protein